MSEKSAYRKAMQTLGAKLNLIRKNPQSCLCLDVRAPPLCWVDSWFLTAWHSPLRIVKAAIFRTVWVVTEVDFTLPIDRQPKQ